MGRGVGSCPVQVDAHDHAGPTAGDGQDPQPQTVRVHTTLSNRPTTALPVIDVQNGVVPGACNRDDVIANINTVVAPW